MFTILILLTTLTLEPYNATQVNQIYDELQKVYDAILLPDGHVDYPKLKHSKELQDGLKSFADYVSRLDFLSIPNQKARAALFSNAYNVSVLLGVNEAWPIESVRDIKSYFGFFTDKRWRLGGQNLSLNQLEKEWIRPIDVRTHFIINCASISCPPLPKQVLREENLDAIMEAATQGFLKDSSKNNFEDAPRVWRLSQIFEWYGKDFGKPKTGVIEFIQNYHPDLVQKPKRIEYITYDWGLNGPTQQLKND